MAAVSDVKNQREEWNCESPSQASHGAVFYRKHRALWRRGRKGEQPAMGFGWGGEQLSAWEERRGVNPPFGSQERMEFCSAGASVGRSRMLKSF